MLLCRIHGTDRNQRRPCRRPFKIIHHTTEGSSAVGVIAAFKKNRSDPHFTVDGMKILQNIDTN